MKKRDLAGMIEHTALGPAVGKADVERVCAEAIAHGFVGAI